VITDGMYHPKNYIKGSTKKWLCCGEKSMDHPGCTAAEGGAPAAAPQKAAPQQAAPQQAVPQQKAPQQQVQQVQQQQQNPPDSPPPQAIRAPMGAVTAAKPAFSGRVAIVTGAASALGFGVAQALVRGGATVVLVDSDEALLNAAVAQLNSLSCLPITGDCSQPEAAAFIMQTAAEQYGRVDILVTTSDMMMNTGLTEIQLPEWHKMITHTMTSAFVMIQEAAKTMQGQGYGRIVVISSVAGRSVAPLGGVHYAAAQSGLVGLARGAAKELAPHGITVNSVCPGLLDIPSTHANLPPTGFRLDVLVKRLGTVEDVSGLVLFLASEQAAYITGASYDVNGGGTCM